MDDLISRRAAIDAVIKRDANCGIDSAEVLKSLPTAQPERKKGKWRVYEGEMVCSCCLCQIPIPKEQRYYANYCLFCGADMRGEERDG